MAPRDPLSRVFPKFTFCPSICGAWLCCWKDPTFVVPTAEPAKVGMEGKTGIVSARRWAGRRYRSGAALVGDAVDVVTTVACGRVRVVSHAWAVTAPPPLIEVPSLAAEPDMFEDEDEVVVDTEAGAGYLD